MLTGARRSLEVAVAPDLTVVLGALRSEVDETLLLTQSSQPATQGDELLGEVRGRLLLEVALEG